MITRITDHVAAGVALLIERFRKPDVSALLGSWLGEVQAVEDALWALLTERAVGTAVGRQLDVLGRIVGQAREGRSDDVYRVWVAARVLVNRSSGATEQLIAIAKKLGAVAGGVGDVRIRLDEHYPAAFTIHMTSPIDAATGAQIARLLRLAKAAGVELHFTWTSLAAGDVFTFAPGDVVIADSDEGFGAGALAAVSDGGDVVFA